MKKVILLVFCFIVLVTFLPTAVQALGVGMGPTTLEIQDALRGGEYERSVFVFNPSEPVTEYMLSTEGEAGDWISFHDLNTKQTIQSVTVNGRSNTEVLLKVKVPSDITNGSYIANIYAETSPAETTGETGVSAIMQAQSVLTVTVTGTQIISGTVASIETHDTEAGFPVRFEVDFINNGNIVVTPQIDFLIIKGSETVAQFSHNQTEVRADQEETISVEWVTSTEQTGEYIAQVSVFLNEELLATKELTFNLLPPGTITKQGELTSLVYEGQPDIDTLIKIVGVFKNTGQGDTRAKLIAEVYFEGTLIDTAISEETLVPIGENGTLTSYYKLTQSGTYAIQGYATYDGKQTDIKVMSIIVSDNSSETSTTEQDNQSLELWIPAVIVIVLAVTVITFILLRRRSKLSS